MKVLGRRRARLISVALVLSLGLTIVISTGVRQARASDTPNPTSVTIAGSFQSELGCPGDWQPECATTHLAFDAGDGVWQGTFNLPAGSYEYKAPLNDRLAPFAVALAP